MVYIVNKFREEKKLLKEIEQNERLKEAIYTMNKAKADDMKELIYKNQLMKHHYKTGNIEAAKTIHQKLTGTKDGKHGEGENRGIGGEDYGVEDQD
jgi:hypothetical protein